MAEQRIDLKQLLFLIKENKDFDANLILDEGCFLETEDPKSLVKVINYVINYLNQYSDRPLEISLDLRTEDYLMSFMVYTDQDDFPAVSDQVIDALQTYNARLDQVHEKGKYLQIRLIFARP